MEAEVTLLWGALCVKSSYTVAHNSLLHTYHTFPTFLRHALTVSYEGFISIAPSFKDQQWEGVPNICMKPLFLWERLQISKAGAHVHVPPLPPHQGLSLGF